MIENNTNNLDVKSELNNEKGNKKYNKRTYKSRKENNNGEKVVKTKKIIKNDKDENKIVKSRKGNGSILDLPTFKNSNLKIIALGGLDEIGKNITIFEYEDEIVLVDCGLEFPDDDMLGVDIVIPDVTYLVRNKNKIKGLFITHGHEDHIGAIPYVLKQVNMPIYATRLTAKLIEHKLEEHRLLRTTKLNIVEQGQIINAGKMSVEFIRSSHSIPDACMLAIHTPAGVVVHTGDFKVDYTPIDGQIIDFARLAELGSKGVLTLLADSTNSERKGFTLSEKSIGPVFDSLFEGCKKRIVVATFASNVHRVQQIVNSAVKFDRKIAVSGRSMINMINSARELNYIDAPDNLFIDIDNIKNYTDEQLVIMTTGSQGETMSALTRMANGEHRKVNLTGNDLVIISATPIPGNEGAVGRTIDNLLRLGCHVVYGKDRGIHVSGHASQEELKTMLNLVRPEYFIPVHGEYRMLRRHGELGVAMGVDPKKVLIGDNGQIFEFDKDGGRKGGRVQAGAIFVDGLGVGDVGNIVIRDRQQLAQEGMVIVVMAMDTASGTIIAGPDLVSRGFVYVRDAEELMLEAERRVHQVLDDCEAQRIKDWTTIKQNVRDALGKFFYDKTRRRPMILPIIQDVH